MPPGLTPAATERSIGRYISILIARHGILVNLATIGISGDMMKHQENIALRSVARITGVAAEFLQDPDRTEWLESMRKGWNDDTQNEWIAFANKLSKTIIPWKRRLRIARSIQFFETPFDISRPSEDRHFNEEFQRDSIPGHRLGCVAEVCEIVHPEIELTMSVAIKPGKVSKDDINKKLESRGLCCEKSNRQNLIAVDYFQLVSTRVGGVCRVQKVRLLRVYGLRRRM